MAAVCDDEWDDPEILQALDQAESEGIRRLSQGDEFQSQSQANTQTSNKNEGRQPPFISRISVSHGSDTSHRNGFHNGFDKTDSSSMLHTSSVKKRPWEEEVEGEYLAALRGSNSQNFQSGNMKGQGKNSSVSGRQTNGTPVDNFAKRHQNENTNFSQTSSYKWSEGGGVRDLGDSGPPPDKNCRCGGGICRVLTASTEKNRGRLFYRCPLSQEEGQCPFFEWCDESSTLGSEEQQLACECGAGMCSVVTAKTEKNNGRKFFRCPLPRETSCQFFKWCDEVGQSPAKKNDNFSGGRTSFSGGYSSSGTGENGGGSGGLSGTCFNCGEEGHWSKDCPSKGTYGGNSSSKGNYGGNSTGGMYDGKSGGSNGSGSCFTCGQDGHWAKDCPSKASSGYGNYGKGGGEGFTSGSGGSGSCFTCGSDGHWSKDCPSKGSGSYGSGSGSKGDGGSRGGCFTCGSDGHWSKDCPSKGSGGYGGYGGYGGSGSNGGNGGYGSQSGGPFQGNYGNRGGTGGGNGNWKSSSDGGRGGWRNDRGGGGGGQEMGGGGGSCYKCGDPGHWSNACPN